MTMDELVQRVAMAMYDFWGPYPEGQEWGGERCAGTVTDNALATARVAIKAIDAAGLAIVPREPTFKMVLAVVGPVKGAEETWRAMVEAANE